MATKRNPIAAAKARKLDKALEVTQGSALVVIDTKGHLLATARSNYVMALEGAVNARLDYAKALASVFGFDWAAEWKRLTSVAIGTLDDDDKAKRKAMESERDAFYAACRIAKLDDNGQPVMQADGKPKPRYANPSTQWARTLDVAAKLANGTYDTGHAQGRGAGSNKAGPFLPHLKAVARKAYRRGFRTQLKIELSEAECQAMFDLGEFCQKLQLNLQEMVADIEAAAS